MKVFLLYRRLVEPLEPNKAACFFLCIDPMLSSPFRMLSKSGRKRLKLLILSEFLSLNLLGCRVGNDYLPISWLVGLFGLTNVEFCEVAENIAFCLGICGMD